MLPKKCKTISMYDEYSIYCINMATKMCFAFVLWNLRWLYREISPKFKRYNGYIASNRDIDRCPP